MPTVASSQLQVVKCRVGRHLEITRDIFVEPHYRYFDDESVAQLCKQLV